MKLFNKEEDLSSLSYKELEEKAQKCTKCALSKTRTKVVFGHGPVPCNLMLIGEGPGEQEDLSGLPFVGKAGQLLTQILASINIDREKDIYIANIVKCRPPENRTPQADETEACYPYLELQIKLIKPKIILLAGAPATKVVLKNEDPISKIRGQWFKLPCLPASAGLSAGTAGTEISVMPIFHPSYLLRNQSKEAGSPKWLTWQDMKEVRGALDFFKTAKELGA